MQLLRFLKVLRPPGDYQKTGQSRMECGFPSFFFTLPHSSTHLSSENEIYYLTETNADSLPKYPISKMYILLPITSLKTKKGKTFAWVNNLNYKIPGDFIINLPRVH